ncbi:MAG: DUF4348 domain-containing protein [Salinivirgaceae bacterium]|nr:DUF4348 domain-containing protein [Bacteroidales bacterium]MBR4621523.1 DUF4348 domain-containing protein [Salinivirgaceae bacterium]
MKTNIFQPAKIIAVMMVAVCILISGCHSSQKTTPARPVSETNKDNTAKKPRKVAKVEDFDKFYNRFHADSAFQMSRIKFPLKGASTNLDKSTPWTPQNWQMLRTRIYDVDKNQYKVKYSKTETSFTQKVWVDGGGFSNECRFELIGGKWFLVYMNDENM